MSLSFQDIKESKVKTKFYSESEDKIMTRSEIIKIVTYDWHRISDEDNYNELIMISHSHKQLPCDLVILESKPFRRWDERDSRMRLHKGECELSTSGHCSCWCNDLYHGLKYQRLSNEMIQN